MRMSAKRAAAAGWSRDPQPAYRPSKFATWRHGSNGWTVRHCGHPTALRPWALLDPDGELRGTADNLEHAFAAVEVLEDVAPFRVLALYIENAGGRLERVGP